MTDDTLKTAETIHATPTKKRIHLRMLLLVAGILALSIPLSVFLWGETYGREIDDSGYEEIRTAAAICPPIRPIVQRAIADNVVTWNEHDDIGQAFAAASRSYSTYMAMAKAKKGLGMLPPPAVPTCHSQTDEFLYTRPFSHWTER